MGCCLHFLEVGGGGVSKYLKKKKIVLASEPVSGRSRVTELPCYFCECVPKYTVTPIFPIFDDYCILWPIYEKLVLKFSFTWVRHKGPPGPPKYEKKFIFFSYFGFKHNFFLSDCFLI